MDYLDLIHFNICSIFYSNCDEMKQRIIQFHGSWWSNGLVCTWRLRFKSWTDCFIFYCVSIMDRLWRRRFFASTTYKRCDFEAISSYIMQKRFWYAVNRWIVIQFFLEEVRLQSIKNRDLGNLFMEPVLPASQEVVPYLNLKNTLNFFSK